MPRTTTSAPPDTPALAPIVSVLLALVVAMEHAIAPSLAATAFFKAIRRKGEDLIQAGGGEALNYALAFIREQAPCKADHREVILSEAWAGLPGWRS
ncbi:hypothetical protein G3T14_22440 [Methylobacterium sp. BTF04]|uniref:hypothetical protein n=1 Tax=Methylobacterium sp. BTF04 TaxID=2708300 RepID=UPI0013D04F7E|nr:hypothetical protein [Methylobacterium sp. BTF04]NEU14833.1 hypothetical protein [Methylobacterium sp. BTF04]